MSSAKQVEQKVNILYISKSAKFYFQIDNFHIHFFFPFKNIWRKKSTGNG